MPRLLAATLAARNPLVGSILCHSVVNLAVAQEGQAAAAAAAADAVAAAAAAAFRHAWSPPKVATQGRHSRSPLKATTQGCHNM